MDICHICNMTCIRCNIEHERGMIIMTEEWKRIVIDDEVWDYEVSTWGRVKSLNQGRTGKTKILKQTENEDGYLFVNLHKNRKKKKCYVHRLVAIAFIPNPQNKPTVNHKDEDKHNNHVDNLEWATMKEQVSHGTRTERSAKTQGKRVRCIETGVIYDSTMEVERQTGLSHSTIVGCCKGKRKTCGGFHWEYYTEETEESES